MFILLVSNGLLHLRLRVDGDLDNVSVKRGVIVHNKHKGDVTQRTDSSYRSLLTAHILALPIPRTN